MYHSYLKKSKYRNSVLSMSHSDSVSLDQELFTPQQTPWAKHRAPTEVSKLTLIVSDTR